MTSRDYVESQLKHLTRYREGGSYECEALGAVVYRTSEGWLVDVLDYRDAMITVVPSLTHAGILEVDRFIGAVLETPLPNAKLRKAASGNWCYDPWRMVIEIAERNPGWGNTFKGGYRRANGHFDLYLGRLTNLRAFLKTVKEKQAARVEHGDA